MLEKYKAGISLFSILTIIAVLFPPIVWETSSRILDTGFAFLLSIPKYKQTTIGGTINFSQLFVELIFIFVIALLYQLNYSKIRNWFKSNF